MAKEIKRVNAPHEWVRFGDLTVDRKLQRELQPKWVEARKDTFDPDAFGVLTISARADKYVILDGQHRGELFKEAIRAPADQLVPCTVLRGLSFAQEAALFLKLNDRVRVSAFDQFRQSVNAGDQIACDIVGILKSVGLRLGQHTGGESEVRAVHALQKVYGGTRRAGKGQNPEVLTATLSLMIDAWGRKSEVFKGEVIHGIGLVLLRDLAALDLGNLSQRLAKQYGTSVYQLIGDARVAKQIHQGSLAHNLAGVVVNVYRKNRRSNDIDTWWK